MALLVILLGRFHFFGFDAFIRHLNSRTSWMRRAQRTDRRQSYAVRWNDIGDWQELMIVWIVGNPEVGTATEIKSRFYGLSASCCEADCVAECAAAKLAAFSRKSPST